LLPGGTATECRAVTENERTMIRVDNGKNRYVKESLQLSSYRSFYWFIDFQNFQVCRSFLNNVLFQDGSTSDSIFRRTMKFGRSNKFVSDMMMTRLCLNVLCINEYVKAILPRGGEFRGAKERLKASAGRLKGRTKRFPLRNICQSDIWECARQVGLTRDGGGRHARGEAGVGCYADH
jgi:hypothetical protein